MLPDHKDVSVWFIQEYQLALNLPGTQNRKPVFPVKFSRPNLVVCEIKQTLAQASQDDLGTAPRQVLALKHSGINSSFYLIDMIYLFRRRWNS